MAGAAIVTRLCRLVALVGVVWSETHALAGPPRMRAPAYIVMERADQSLEAALRAGALDDGMLRTFLLDMAEGLVAIHEQEMIHRDLKPANMLIFVEGGVRRLKIGDFGLVRSLKTSK